MYSSITSKNNVNSIACYLRFVSFTFLLFLGNLAVAAPKPDLWQYWSTYDPASTVQVNYQPWNHFLSQYLVSDKKGNTLVKYGSVSDSDKQALNQFIDKMISMNPLLLNRNQQFAYWVNLYNALTVQLILKNYPVKSITKLGGFFSFGPWNDKITTINGKAMTLNDIEHRILRPIWKDKRIHYVVNCASMSCLNLRIKALDPNHLNAELSQAETEFINSPKAVKEVDGNIILSEIYDWYAVDFGDKASLIQYLSSHLKNKALKEKIEQPDVTLKYQYNWSLNEFK